MTQTRAFLASRRALSVPNRTPVRHVGITARNIARQTTVVLNPLFPNSHPFTVDLTTPFFRKELVKFFAGALRPLLDVMNVQLPAGWASEETRINVSQFVRFIARFNARIDEFKSRRASRHRTPQIWQQLSQPILPYEIIKGILTFVRDVVNRDEYELRAGTFGDTVYGRTSDDQIQSFVEELEIGEDDVFVDLGSGIGNAVCLVAATARVSKAVGVELGEAAAGVAGAHHQLFQAVMSWFGHHRLPIELHKGTFLEQQYLDLVKNEATIVFINNKVFSAVTMNPLKELFAECNHGLKIISTDELCSTTRSNRGNPLENISTTRNLKLTENNAGWQGAPCPYFVTEIKRRKVSAPAPSVSASTSSRSRSRR